MTQKSPAHMLVGIVVIIAALAIVARPLVRDVALTGFVTSSQLTTTVSVGSTAPTIASSAVTNPITLAASTAGTIVWCNVTVNDLNGNADIANVNATLYYNGSTLNGATNTNLRYVNTSCAAGGAGSGTWKDYNCSFTMHYCAHVAKVDDGFSWTCTVIANGSSGLINTADSTSNVTDIVVNSLVAISTNQTAVAYGSVSPGSVSGGVEILLTNFGNVPMDLNMTGSNLTNTSGITGFTAIKDINVSNQNYSTAITFDEPEDNGIVTNASLTNATYALSNASACASGFAGQAAQNRSAWFRIHVDTGQPGTAYQGYINLVASDGT